MGETHGHDKTRFQKPRQGRQEPVKFPPAAPAGALVPVEFNSVGSRQRLHPVATSRLSTHWLLPEHGAVQLVLSLKIHFFIRLNHDESITLKLHLNGFTTPTAKERFQ